MGAATLLQWVVLGAGGGILTARLLFMMFNGVGAILPLFVLWGVVGWMAAGWVGLVCGGGLACVIGLFVGR